MNNIVKRIQYKYKGFDIMVKFIPSKNEKIVISIRLEIDKINKIDEIANKINISRNELINQCLDFSLNNLEFKNNNN